MSENRSHETPRTPASGEGCPANIFSFSDTSRKHVRIRAGTLRGRWSEGKGIPISQIGHIHFHAASYTYQRTSIPFPCMAGTTSSVHVDRGENLPPAEVTTASPPSPVSACSSYGTGNLIHQWREQVGYQITASGGKFKRTTHITFCPR